MSSNFSILNFFGNVQNHTAYNKCGQYVSSDILKESSIENLQELFLSE